MFFLRHLPPSSFLEGLSSEQFAELGSVHLLAFTARACSLAFLSLGVFFLAICRAVLIYLVPFSVCSKAFLSLVILLILAIQRAHFSYSSQGFLVGLLLPRIFSPSGSVLSSTPYIGLLCLPRMHAINSCVGDTGQRL